MPRRTALSRLVGLLLVFLTAGCADPITRARTHELLREMHQSKNDKAQCDRLFRELAASGVPVIEWFVCRDAVLVELGTRPLDVCQTIAYAPSREALMDALDSPLHGERPTHLSELGGGCYHYFHH